MAVSGDAGGDRRDEGLHAMRDAVGLLRGLYGGRVLLLWGCTIASAGFDVVATTLLMAAPMRARALGSTTCAAGYRRQRTETVVVGALGGW